MEASGISSVVDLAATRAGIPLKPWVIEAGENLFTIRDTQLRELFDEQGEAIDDNGVMLLKHLDEHRGTFSICIIREDDVEHTAVVIPKLMS